MCYKYNENQVYFFNFRFLESTEAKIKMLYSSAGAHFHLYLKAGIIFEDKHYIDPFFS